MSQSPGSTILIVDDNETHAQGLAEGLSRVGHKCILAFNGNDGSRLLKEKYVDILLTDLVMHDVDGMNLLRQAKEKSADIEVIMITGHGTVETAVEAMREGAANYLVKPVNIDELRALVDKAVEKQGLGRRNIELQKQLDEKFGFEGILGETGQMHKLFETVKQIADTTVTVLITGESGTGKELLAQTIHNNSRRKGKPFAVVDCASIPEGILASELFGHEKGAFTHAISQRKGRFEYAHGGTLLLDEVSEMPLTTQVKFLRVIEQREVTRVGGNEPIPVDVRLIAATNRDLEEQVEKEKFRKDLYFRLKVVTLRIPPLRERHLDIPILANHFIKTLAEKHQRDVTGINEEAMDILCGYDWPGNIRELKNCVESMVVTSGRGALTEKNIPEDIRAGSSAGSGLTIVRPGSTLADAEEQLILSTLEGTGGNREKAAQMLGIGERTLYRKLKEYRGKQQST